MESGADYSEIVEQFSEVVTEEKSGGSEDQIEAPRFTAKSLAMANGAFSLRVEEIVSGEDWLGDGVLEISLLDSNLEFDPIHISLPGGGFDARVRLFPEEDGINANVWASINDFDYGIMARRVDPDTKMSGRIFLNIDLQSQARYLDRFMANADGHINFIVLPEFFEAGIIDLWASSLLMAMLPKIGSSPSLINCLIARFIIEDGLMKEDELYLDTSKLRAAGEGEINFKEETISYVLKPKAKNAGFFQVQAPLEIEGKFSEMEFGLQGGLVGTTLRMIATTYTVPIRMLMGNDVPADGSDICVPPPPRELADKAQEEKEPE